MDIRTDGNVCFPINKDKVLLVLIDYGEKKLWNGIGGWVEVGETLEEGLAREFEEEVGLKIDKTKLKKVHMIKKERADGSNWHLNVFLLMDFQSELKLIDPSLKELRWFDFDKVPYQKMWPDNKDWLPKILKSII